jgi:hypothetical protein
VNNKFVNVDQDAFIYLMDPPEVWAVIDDCGEFPCTGPRNVFLNFQGTTYDYTKDTPTNTASDFAILSNNPTAVAGLGCIYYSTWNSNYCSKTNYGMLLFESLDSDRYQRTVSPIVITDPSLTYSNTLNSFMDHLWDGFYTSQLRLSRFPAMVDTVTTGYAGKPTQIYNITYIGTPPSD